MGHSQQIDRRAGPSRGLMAALLLASLVHAGCASTDSRDRSAIDDDAARTVRHTVVAGDRLAAIARAVTGDMDTWQAIAEHNGIDDPRTLAIGSVVEIPGSLIPLADDPVVITAEPEEPKPVSRSEAKTAVASVGAPEVPVVVSPVRSNRDFELAPLDQNADDRYGTNRFVKIIGTYYPIAIYAEPEGFSRLMVRVTPGTVLPLDREVGDWLRVTTDVGPGYLRSTDGEILSARDRSASLAE